ncbi:PTAC2, partial [Symbiodinium sp. KB8]
MSRWQDFTTLISAYGAVGKWRQALSAFDEMQKQGVEAGTFGYSAVIRALGRKQQWEGALMLLEEACAQGIQSDTALFSSAMKACDLDSERVLRLFSDMQDADLVP